MVDIPIKLTDNNIYNFTKHGGTVQLLHTANLLIWDETAMTSLSPLTMLINVYVYSMMAT